MRRNRAVPLTFLLLLLSFPAACGTNETPAFPSPAEDYSHIGLSDAEAASLLSLEQVDDHPLYTMRHYAAYGYEEYAATASRDAETSIDDSNTELVSWACSLFAALADPESQLYGRNFDWYLSPALLLFADPPDGHASVAMVDIAYLGFGGEQSESLTSRPLADLVALLDAPHIPFDGLNAAGLAVGMAAVPPGDVPPDPEKDTLGSLGVMRIVLDKAATIEEALDIMLGYNIDFEGGPPVHYLMADSEGNSALVEYYGGEVHVFRRETPWHHATNFLIAAVESPAGKCWRYDALSAELEASRGALDLEGAMSLLQKVSNIETQWSVVYGMSTGDIRVVMGREYEQVHAFSLDASQ